MGDLRGRLFVTSGLGGMSGAQGKACEIAKGVAIVAEVDLSRINTRLEQGWVNVIANTPEEAFRIAEEKQKSQTPYAIAYHGNIVDILEYAIENNKHIDLLSGPNFLSCCLWRRILSSRNFFEERTRPLGWRQT